jgi:succinate dehydrogenase / fumarate reductase flavoprotein subunit
VTGDYQSKLTLMSESLRNDGRIWVPRQKGDTRPPNQIPERARLLPGGEISELRQPGAQGHRLARRQAVCDAGLRRVGPGGQGVYLDFADAIQRLGKDVIRRALRQPLRHVRAHHRRKSLPGPHAHLPGRFHYTMGGLWVDYNLMSTIPGLFVLGEANFSDHGANRLGASALMQGLADGYFILPYTIGDYPGLRQAREGQRDHPAFREAEAPSSNVSASALLLDPGLRTVDSFHRELGRLVWEYCGMARNAQGLKQAPEPNPRAARGVLEQVNVLGGNEELNQSAGKGRARRRLHRTGRADVPGRPAPQRILRRPLSARSTRRRKGEALRDDENGSATSPPGNSPAPGAPAGAAQRAAHFRIREALAQLHGKELQMRNLILHVWRQKNARTLRGAWCATRPGATSSDAHVVPGDARRAERGADRQRARSRSRLITTAERASAACAAS